MRQIPSTIVLCLVFLVFASWPSVQDWAEISNIHHFFVHGLYVLSGALFGLQTSWWLHRASNVQHVEETGVSS